ncbi:hypothetical protein [Thiothrix nivea]|uniref:Uncharacterized protein n=1 Tax=Thiothrix nivea (strain ATCC 35100 / DSM 5205 / JP2) TaxID=870187 RepID=A0A656HN58_THINJ|nr:hypothetical protein [Thiothrix nivea]EIJ36966.1 hypothetical protein Thini_4492 [Thiothrix nivea DSM 5205]
MSRKDINTFSLLLSEVLFTMFPFIVIAITIFYKQGTTTSIFQYPDWAVAASVLNGQSVIKLISGAIASDIKTHWQRVALIVTLLIVVCFAPSLIILTLLLISDKPSDFLISAQLILFLLSFIGFFWIGKTGHDLAEHIETKKPNDYVDDGRGDSPRL